MNLESAVAPVVVSAVERSAARPYRSWVEVSRTQIAKNFLSIRQAVDPDVEIMAVVKADAYRHGAVEVSRTLEASGARWLAVSNTDEGVALRDAGIQTRILVIADFLPFTRDELIARQLTPAIQSLAALQELNVIGAARNEKLKCHLKIDSGMGRLGVRAPAAEIANAILAARNVEVEGLMTHFASAANYQGSQTEEQIANFESTINFLAHANIRPSLIHLSSTIPVAYARRRAWRGMVRPGHAVYGYVSPVRGHAPDEIIDVRPALTWHATVLAVKDVPSGALIGYGGMFQTKRPSRIAILAAGYADGIPHRLSNRGSVIVNGRIAPMIGAVSMDLTTIDVTDAGPVAVGDPVMLLGRQGDVSIDAQSIAKLAGTISYSVLCGIHARVKRIYI
jgi:alanine racemase